MTETSAIVTLAAMKAHLRVDDSFEDVGLAAMLEAARRHVEAWVGPLDDFEVVPADVVEAMKMHAALLYESREAALSEASHMVPLGYYDLIGPYRKWEF